MRDVWRLLRKLWAGMAIAVFVPVLVCRVVGVACGFMWRRRRTRTTFYDTLRKAGLSEREASELTARYHAKLRIRELLAHFSR